MLQPTLNQDGWGYDLCFSFFCPNISLGVSDKHTAIHHKGIGRLDRNISLLANQFIAKMVCIFEYPID